MLLSLSVRRAAACLGWGLVLAAPAAVFGQAYYQTNGTEYAIVGSLPGDQVLPDVALNSSGGFVVWQDNVTDGSGWGVSAMRLNGTLSGSGSSFRVNVQGTNDQANARVALLQNGGAVFVWQGGKSSQEQIYARFLSPNNTWLTTSDVPVSAQFVTNVFVLYGYTTNKISTVTTNWNLPHTRITGYTTNTTTTVTTTVATNTTVSTVNFQINPAVATLANGNVVIVWGSFNQAGPNTLQDVYGQILSPAGVKIGAEFLINQFTPYNQRTPTVAALSSGGFVVAWVSEQERVVGAPNAYPGTTPSQMAYPSVDIYARLYDANGNPQSDEFLVNGDSNPCAHPSVAAGTDGGFVVAWDAKDMTSPNTNSLDIYARSFTSAGAGSGSTIVRVNTYLYGDQYAPRISSLGTDYLITWTSLAQDGSREGVYGQFLRGNGSEFGGEFRVTTTTISSQMQPAVASDGVNQFLVVWTSYTGAPYGFDLYAQRYQNVAAVLQPMAAPFVWAPFLIVSNQYQPQLQVSWPPLLGISVSNYEVYVDGTNSPTAVTTNNVWMMTAANGLTASSTHWFQLDYVTTDGRSPSRSAATTNSTWSGYNWGGIPWEWMTIYFGSDISKWPAATADSDGDGMSNYQEFLAGTNPTNAASVLRVQISQTPPALQSLQAQQSGQTSLGMYVSWNTQPGLTYQVQVTTNFTSWSNLGAPRFAAGTSDSIYVGGGSMGYYRIVLLRQ
ncbi:MAG: thrombospondin type 3 repeat-containing protein [Verrucomicrobiota bacterium]